MIDKISVTGKIGFEPENKTKKHNVQSSWKRMAMVHIDGDVAEYYAWFIKKRFNLELNRPLRGSHITFINDSIKDLSGNGIKTMEEVNATWNAVKAKWDKKRISLILDLNPRTDDRTWWLNIPQEERELLQGVRNELGLGQPFWGLHMTIGTAEHLRYEHSVYIHNLIKKGFITT